MADEKWVPLEGLDYSSTDTKRNRFRALVSRLRWIAYDEGDKVNATMGAIMLSTYEELGLPNITHFAFGEFDPKRPLVGIRSLFEDCYRQIYVVGEPDGVAHVVMTERKSIIEVV